MADLTPIKRTRGNSELFQWRQGVSPTMKKEIFVMAGPVSFKVKKGDFFGARKSQRPLERHIAWQGI
jgi:hypothetical protein